jgi:hypothetical protein
MKNKVYGIVNNDKKSVGIVHNNNYSEILLLTNFSPKNKALEIISEYCRKKNISYFYFTCTYTKDNETIYKSCDTCGTYGPIIAFKYLFNPYACNEYNFTCEYCMNILKLEREELNYIEYENYYYD